MFIKRPATDPDPSIKISTVFDSLARDLRQSESVSAPGRGVAELDEDLQQVQEEVEREIIRLELQNVRSFFTLENLNRVGENLCHHNFVCDLADMVRNPGLYIDQKGEKKKRKMLQLIAEGYNKHLKSPYTIVELSDDGRSSGPSEDGHPIYGSMELKTRKLRVNRKVPEFTTSFPDLINTVVHECTHNAQGNSQYRRHPYLTQLYRANFDAYQTLEEFGFKLYRAQPVEIGAFAAGNEAERLINEIFIASDMVFRPTTIWRKTVEKYRSMLQ